MANRQAFQIAKKSKQKSGDFCLLFHGLLFFYLFGLLKIKFFYNKCDHASSFDVRF